MHNIYAKGRSVLNMMMMQTTNDSHKAPGQTLGEHMNYNIHKLRCSINFKLSLTLLLYDCFINTVKLGGVKIAYFVSRTLHGLICIFFFPCCLSVCMSFSCLSSQSSHNTGWIKAELPYKSVRPMHVSVKTWIPVTSSLPPSLL